MLVATYFLHFQILIISLDTVLISEAIKVNLSFILPFKGAGGVKVRIEPFLLYSFYFDC